MKCFKNFLLFSFAVLALTTFITPAYALPITPDSYFMVASGPETAQPQIDAAIIAAGYSIGFELYKDNVGGVEEGPLAGSYDTEYFFDTLVTQVSGDPDYSGADITWAGDPFPFISDNPYLLVKDGSHDPAWYLFDLAAAGWDGTEVLRLSNFWPGLEEGQQGSGAISHVALYGSNPVPEPATMALFGLGLIGLAGISRKTRKS